MTILVTGATGFVGVHTINALKRIPGLNLITLSRGKHNGEQSAKHIQYDLLSNKSLELSAWTEEIPDKLIHLAWSGLPNYHDTIHIEQTLPAQIRFLKSMIVQGVRDITVAGTCFEYGMKDGCLTEEVVADPDNSYAIAKDTLRKYLQKFQSQQVNLFTYKWARMFYMYGPGQGPRSLFTQLSQAVNENQSSFKMSGGEQIRDFLSVEEATYQLTELAINDVASGIYNICSGHPKSVRSLVEDLMKGMGQSIALELGHYPYPDYEPFAFWGSNKKLSSILT